ncbi:MAG: hypothetical protein M1825_003387 [Sarcosagium campestre]|nr:MAG: hypothetical protein M1825_003387 [Sarcosagium campestre]
MAAAEPPSRLHERHFRKRPFSSWVKKLTSLKNSSSEATVNGNSNRRSGNHSSSKAKKSHAQNTNPYPQSGLPVGARGNHGNGKHAVRTSSPAGTDSVTTYGQAGDSIRSSSDGAAPPTQSSRSAAPTVSTNPDANFSDTAQSTNAESAAGTNGTLGGAMSSHGGGGSTFSSPAPSVRSLTTTLTTIQSTAPSALLPGGNPTLTGAAPASIPDPNYSSGHQQHASTHFSHQFPTSPPASAVPPHLIPPPSGGNPSTYSAATANNLLTDNASILTLASSSKRQRRHSLDTNASVRALAPSSLFGGSRESLPLSMLSANAGEPPTSAPGLHQSRPSVGGITTAERASIYSAGGIAPALSSERNSYYAGKQGITADGGSIKSGLLGHGRNDSITGSIGAGGTVQNPAASPLVTPVPALSERLSRRDSGWGDVTEETAATTVDNDDEKRLQKGKDMAKATNRENFENSTPKQ